MKRLMRIGSIAVLLLALNANAVDTEDGENVEKMTFSSLSEEKAYKEKLKQDEIDKKEAIENERKQFIKQVQTDLKVIRTKVIKKLLLKNKDTIETIEDKFKNSEKLLQEIANDFDEFHSKYEDYYVEEMTSWGTKTVDYFFNGDSFNVSSFFHGLTGLEGEVEKINFDINNKIIYTATNDNIASIDGDTHSDEFGTPIKKYERYECCDNYLWGMSNPYFNDDIYSFLSRKITNSEDDNRVELALEYYKKYLQQAFDSYEERQTIALKNEKIYDEQIKLQKKCEIWRTKAQKKNNSLKKGDRIRTSSRNTLVIDFVDKDRFYTSTPILYQGTTLYLKENFSKNSCVPESEMKNAPYGCGY